MRLCQLYDIQEQAYRLAVLFEMDRHGNERLVVWGRPGVRGEIQLPIIFLAIR
jgi:hypothetical protein